MPCDAATRCSSTMPATPTSACEPGSSHSSTPARPATRSAFVSQPAAGPRRLFDRDGSPSTSRPARTTTAGVSATTDPSDPTSTSPPTSSSVEVGDDGRSLVRPVTLTPEQYDRINAQMAASQPGTPPGHRFHACFGPGDHLMVFDVWDSTEALDAFTATLIPILAIEHLDM